MITLITAVPGSGKTLLAVSLIDKYNQEKRLVYHNINGLRLDKFAHPELILDAPDDWRETPANSVVIYDECQQIYGASGKAGRVADPRLTDLETHRHGGYDLYFITQAPTFVHHHVRKLVGEHIHLYRGFGSTTVSKYTWSHTCDSPNDRQEQQRANHEIFAFPKKYFDYYKSAEVHTHKFKIPKKIIYLFTFLAFAFGYAVFHFASSGFLGSKHPTGNNVVSLPLGGTVSHVYEVKDTKSSRRYLSGCIASKNNSRCRCYDDSGYPVSDDEISHSQCVIYTHNPMPRKLQLSSS